jgi:hypothetical protein
MKDINRLTPAERFDYHTGLWLKDPIDECDNCGEDLFVGVRHDTWVIVEPAEE